MKLGIETKGLARKIEKIPQIYKAIVTLILVAGLVGVLIYFVMMPQYEARTKILKENTELQQQLDHLRDLKNNLEKHRKEYAEMQELLQEVLRQLPETKDIPNLLRNITGVSEETRLKIKFFEPKELQAKDFYSELPFEIRFSGPFHNVAYFFDGIRRMERIVNITNFSLEAKGTPKNIVLDGTCTASAYVYTKEQPRVGKKDGKQPNRGDTVDKK